MPSAGNPAEPLPVTGPEGTPVFDWGPAPFGERDVDVLLSGDRGDTPPQLRQVADALAALRAAPAQAELSGEAAIMAEFSAAAELRAQGLSGTAAGANGQAHTLTLPPHATRKRG